VCILRAFGDKFNPADFLRTSSLQPYSTYRRGDRRSRSGESVHEVSGLKIEISTAKWTDRASQFHDAIEFLRSNRADLQRLTTWNGVEGVVLDFPFEAGDGSATFIRCPIALARESAALNIELEFSIYPCKNPRTIDLEYFTGCVAARPPEAERPVRCTMATPFTRAYACRSVRGKPIRNGGVILWP